MSPRQIDPDVAELPLFEIDRRRPSIRPLHTGPWTALYLIALPPAAVVLYGIAPFFLQNGVDPFIYTGYIFRSNDLIDRYGYTYYSVRFGLLAPAQLFTRLFGVSGGYFALRWALVSGACWVAVVWCRRIRSPQLVWLVAALFVVNPVVIRAVMTVYADTIGVPAAFAACALLLMPGTTRQRVIACVGAGLLLGLLVNANLYFAVPFGAALLVWFVVRLVTSRREALLEAVSVGAAILGVTLVGALWFRWHYGDGNILQPSIDAARRLGDVMSSDDAPNRQWLDFRPYLYLPLVAIALHVTVLIRRRCRPEWYEVAAIGMMVAVGAVFLQDEFLSNGFLLETYFYTSYFIGPTILILLMGIRRLVTGESAGRVGGALAVIVLVFPYAWHLVLDEFQFWAIPTIPLLLALIVGCVIVNRPGASLVLAGVMVLSIQLLTLGAPRDVPLAAGQAYRREPLYDRSIFRPGDESLDRYELAADFTALLPRWSDTPGTVVFWYPEKDETANLMGSTYLWYETTLTMGPPGLPQLDDDAAAHLVGRTPRYLVLVSADDATADAGVEAVERVVTPVDRKRHELRLGSSRIVVDVLELSPGSCDLDLAQREVYWRLQPPCGRSPESSFISDTGRRTSTDGQPGS